MTAQPAHSAPPQAPTAHHSARHPSLPPYRETAADLRQQIQTGHLPPGHRLPPLRVMAEHYKIAVATARSALRVLQDEGLVYTRQGSGSFITAAPAPAEADPAPPSEWQACACTVLGHRIDELTSTLRDLLQRLPQTGPDHQGAAAQYLTSPEPHRSRPLDA